jgi:hypothetical protein
MATLIERSHLIRESRKKKQLKFILLLVLFALGVSLYIINDSSNKIDKLFQKIEELSAQHKLYTQSIALEEPIITILRNISIEEVFPSNITETIKPEGSGTIANIDNEEEEIVLSSQENEEEQLENSEETQESEASKEVISDAEHKEIQTPRSTINTAEFKRDVQRLLDGLVYALQDKKGMLKKGVKAWPAFEQIFNSLNSLMFKFSQSDQEKLSMVVQWEEAGYGNLKRGFNEMYEVLMSAENGNKKAKKMVKKMTGNMLWNTKQLKKAFNNIFFDL